MRGGMPPKGSAMGKPKMDKGLLKRILGLLIKSYPVLIPIVVLCIVLSAVVSSIPSIFMQKVFAAVDVRIGVIRDAAGVSGLMSVSKEWITANSAFLYAIPYGAAIALCLLFASLFYRKEIKQV